MHDSMPLSSRQPTATNQTVDAEPVTPTASMGKRKATPPVKNPQRLSGWDTSDDEFDRQLLERFPIGALLPLSNTAYDLIREKRKFLNEKTSNDIEKIRTRKPIRTLTKQEKQNMERAPLIFLKDCFEGPQPTINTNLGQKIDQVARKTGTIARKIKKIKGFWSAIQNFGKWFDR